MKFIKKSFLLNSQKFHKIHKKGFLLNSSKLFYYVKRLSKISITNTPNPDLQLIVFQLIYHCFLHKEIISNHSKDTTIQATVVITKSIFSHKLCLTEWTGQFRLTLSPSMSGFIFIASSFSHVMGSMGSSPGREAYMPVYSNQILQIDMDRRITNKIVLILIIIIEICILLGLLYWKFGTKH